MRKSTKRFEPLHRCFPHGRMALLSGIGRLGAGLLVVMACAARAAELTPAADTYCSNASGETTKNFGIAGTLRIKAATANRRFGLVRFDLGELLLPVASASLRFTVTEPKSGQSAYVYMVKEDEADENFGETTVTWNSSSIRDGSDDGIDQSKCVLLGTISLATAETVTLSDAAVLENLNADTNGRFTLAIRRVGTSDTGVQSIASRENGVSPPVTLVTTALEKPAVAHGAHADVAASMQATVYGSLVITGASETAVAMYWGTQDGGTVPESWAATNHFPSPQVPQDYEVPLENLATNLFYFYRFSATNAAGTAWAAATDGFLTGEMRVEALRGGREDDAPFDAFRVYRPASASAGAVTVPLTVDGTAQEGVHIGTLADSVTLAAGSSEALVQVAPIPEWAVYTNRTVSLTLGGGPYLLGDAVSATITVTNAPVPYVGASNVWWSTASSSASLPENWSLGHVPAADEVVVLDGAISSADMVWDSTAGAEVSGWLQLGSYAGTVTLATVYPEFGGFTNMVVSGDMSLDGGRLQPELNVEYEQYRLRLDVRGDLRIGAAGIVSATGRGFQDTANNSQRDDGPGSTGDGAAHGGLGGAGSTNTQTYGSILWPESLGSGTSRFDEGGNQRGHGGGAVWIDVGGDLRVDGLLLANGLAISDKWRGTGSGGSMLLRAGTLSGGGVVQAMGGNNTAGSDEPETGGGGRIAVRLTAPGAGFGGGPTLSAAGGDSRRDDRQGAPGTIYLETAADGAGRGLVVVDNGSRVCQRETDMAPTFTGMCAGKSYAFTDDLTLTRWQVGANANLRLTRDERVVAVSLAGPTSGLILDGHRLTVDALDIVGVPYGAGTYTTNSLPVNVVGDGSVVVRWPGTAVIVR